MNLEKVYKKYLSWVRTHEARFNPGKSELIHIIGRKRKVPMASITLKGKVIKPSRSIRFLGVHLSQNLSYKAYLDALNTKIPVLLNALRSITSSTQGTPLLAARTLYRGAIRPVLAYGALFWCPEDLEKAKGLAKTLQSIQKRFLRAITGAYKATSGGALEIETFIEPLDLYIEKTSTKTASKQVLRGYRSEGRHYYEVLQSRYKKRRWKRRLPSSSSSSSSPSPSESEPRNPKKPPINEILIAIAANPLSTEY